MVTYSSKLRATRGRLQPTKTKLCRISIQTTETDAFVGIGLRWLKRIAAVEVLIVLHELQSGLTVLLNPTVVATLY